MTASRFEKDKCHGKDGGKGIGGAGERGLFVVLRRKVLGCAEGPSQDWALARRRLLGNQQLGRAFPQETNLIPS